MRIGQPAETDYPRPPDWRPARLPPKPLTRCDRHCSPTRRPLASAPPMLLDGLKVEVDDLGSSRGAEAAVTGKRDEGSTASSETAELPAKRADQRRRTYFGW
jgi:hypothetical protein